MQVLDGSLRGGENMPRLAERLRGRRFLVTGSTGLLAKLFVEKLLRSVPEIDSIQLLVRPGADGTNAADRLQGEVLGSSVFDRLRASVGARFDDLCAEKIKVLSGDLTEERLGLSAAEYEALPGQIDVIVNSAAAVTFDERLDIAVRLNTQGPCRLLELARACNNAPFMQVSTCYVSGRRSGDIPEALLEPAGGARLDLDSVVRQLQETADRISAEPHPDNEARRKALIAGGMELARRYGWNDTYTFTKWLAEQLIDRDRGDVPLVILRPAIIEGSLEEPMPGWIDGLRMADPMILAYGRGKLGEFPANPNVPIDVIPVDLVANAMIAALPLPGDPPGTRVYQVGSSARNPLRISQLAQYLEEAFERRPFVEDDGKQINPGPFKLVRSEDFMKTWEQRLHEPERSRAWQTKSSGAPADRRRAGSIRQWQSQIEQILYFARIYSPYTHLDCRFLDDRLRELADSLHPDDRAEFPFAVEDIDWHDYIVHRHIPGLRKFVLGGTKFIQRPGGATMDLPDRRQVRQSLREAGTVFDAFARTAEMCPGKTAMQINRGGRWLQYTYSEALAATGSIARRFGEFGLAPGDRVVLYGENCPEWGLTYLAAIRAGLTAVPLDPQLLPDEVDACTKFAGAKLICAGRTTYEALIGHGFESETRTRNPRSCRSPCTTKTSGTGFQPVNQGQDAPATCSHNSESNPVPVWCMVAPLIPPPGASRDAFAPPVAVASDRIASILFTSGTTVSPKAVPLTHANFLANARALLQVHDWLGPSDEFLSVLPMYHAFEFTAGFLVPLSLGATITYVEQLKGPEIIAAMQATGATIMLVVPRLLKLFHDGIQRKVQASGALSRSAFSMLQKLSDLSKRRLARKLFAKVHRQFGGRLRMFVSGGSALDPELHAAFARMGFTVCVGYGLTETAPVLTVNPPDGGKPGAAGLPLPGVELRIESPDDSGVGELWARGPNVMQGYLNNPQATAEVMREGWFRTGDLCRRDQDGYYYVTGRVKDLIVTDAGKNVYPDEVESRYAELPHVKELCAVGLPNEQGAGECVHAVIVPDMESAADLDPSTVERMIREAASAIGAAIPTHQRIQHLHFWNTELPKTSTMKAKRSVIRERLLNREAMPKPTAKKERREPGAIAARERVSGTPSLSDGQLFVRRMLARLTHKPESAIHPESNLLMDLGVDSLMKLEIIGELEGRFDVSCSEETAAAMARVQDLYALIGDHAMHKANRDKGRSWLRSALNGKPSEHEPAEVGGHAGNGKTPGYLLPARWATRGGIGLFFRSYIRVKPAGLENVPSHGPFVLAANHTSHLDAASVLTAVPSRPDRRIWVAGAQDYFFNTRIKSWVFGNLFDTIPFDRQTEGFKGLRRCIEALEHGDAVLFFPEGTRSVDGKIQPFKMGVAAMAVEAGAPVVPTRIDHAFELLRKGSRFVRPGVVRVTFGEPISPEPWICRDDLETQHRLYRELTAHIQSRVEALGRQDAMTEALV